MQDGQIFKDIASQAPGCLYILRGWLESAVVETPHIARSLQCLLLPIHHWRDPHGQSPVTPALPWPVKRQLLVQSSAKTPQSSSSIHWQYNPSQAQHAASATAVPHPHRHQQQMTMLLGGMVSPPLALSLVTWLLASWIRRRQAQAPAHVEFLISWQFRPINLYHITKLQPLSTLISSQARVSHGGERVKVIDWEGAFFSHSEWLINSWCLQTKPHLCGSD